VKEAELNEMVPAAAGTELRPGTNALFSLVTGLTEPISVQNFMLTTILEARPNTEPRFGFDGAGEAVLMPLQCLKWEVEHGHFHAAGDVHPDSVRDDRVFGSEHAADGQTVTDVGIGHEGTSHRDGQQARLSPFASQLHAQGLRPTGGT